MIRTFIRTISKPHPFIFNYKSVLVPSLATFALIFFFKPRKATNPEIWSNLFLSFTSSFITAFAITVIVFSLKPFIKTEKWSITKELLLICSVVAFISILHYVFFISIATPINGYLDYFFQVVLKTLLISVFPIVVLVLFEQYNHTKAQLLKVKHLNNQINKKSTEKDTNKSPVQVFLYAENQKLVFKAKENQVGYLKSEGNYVEVFYYDINQQLKKVLIRNKLKKLEEQLSGTSIFFSCHRSYLINLDHVSEIKGNARNMEVFLSDFNVWIPISRNKTNQLQSRLEAE